MKITESMSTQVMDDAGDAGKPLATLSCTCTSGEHMGINMVVTSSYDPQKHELLMAQALRDFMAAAWRKCADAGLPVPAENE